MSYELKGVEKSTKLRGRHEDAAYFTCEERMRRRTRCDVRPSILLYIAGVHRATPTEKLPTNHRAQGELAHA